MSRSLGHKALHKKVQKEGGLDAEGRKMFADGLPCPPDNGDHGKDHARAKGWRRAAAEARQPKNRKAAAQAAAKGT
ncbi:hypothetical protein [Delftia deserti]|uniref:Uncharacterized protein n=1 Tax=Delftia deserti TaxID=1651218 RepID=A0ABW5EZH0_9BURK